MRGARVGRGDAVGAQQRRGGHQRLVKSVVAVVAILGLLAAVIYIVQGARRPTTVSKAQPRTTVEVTAAPTYSAYVGQWCDSENATRPTMSEEGMSQVTIEAADVDSVTFSVLHTGAAPAYRMTGSETTITAPIVNEMASFEFRDERGSMNSGTIQFLDNRLVVEIQATSAASDANGSVAMNCMMLRDQHVFDREVLEPQHAGPFLGVVGSYACASEPTDIPTIEVMAVDDGRVVLDLTGTDSDAVYYRNLEGRITGDAEAVVTIEEADVVLRLRWENPGTIHVDLLEGEPSGPLQRLLDAPTYWNSEYLHTS